MDAHDKLSLQLKNALCLAARNISAFGGCVLESLSENLATACRTVQDCIREGVTTMNPSETVPYIGNICRNIAVQIANNITGETHEYEQFETKWTGFKSPLNITD